MGQSELLFFGGFLTLIFTMLFIDLGVFSRKSHVIGFKEAISWTSVWVIMAAAFYVFLTQYGEIIHNISNPGQLATKIREYEHSFLLSGNWETDIQAYRTNLALEFLTGYLIEYALSIDNIFVMIVIFGAFHVKEKHYKQILFWGVLGAIVMRFLFIFLGASLLENFHWLMYVFGGILLYTGIKLLYEDQDDEHIDTSKHPVVRFLGTFLRVFPRFVGNNFFIRKNGHLFITPLFVVLMVVEFTDVVFAFDSVPAIFSVTKDPYIVFFSNIFAIMGLRSLFFLLSNIMHLFHYLKFGLGILMLFIGLKMMFHNWMLSWGITTEMSLYIILGILALSVLASIIFPQPKQDDSAHQP